MTETTMSFRGDGPPRVARSRRVGGVDRPDETKPILGPRSPAPIEPNWGGSASLDAGAAKWSPGPAPDEPKPRTSAGARRTQWRLSEDGSSEPAISRQLCRETRR